MSEGERVVFEFTGDDRLVRKGEFYTDQRDARNGVMLANKEGRFIESFILRRIPDPVPALQARIAELEGALAEQSSPWCEALLEVIRVARLPCLTPVDQVASLIREKLAAKQLRIEELEGLLLNPPTPAAAKET